MPEERGCNGGPTLCTSLNSGALLLCQSRLPHSHPLSLSPHGQQQSPPRVCSLNPMFQPPAPMCTSRRLSQAGPRRAVARTTFIGLTLSCLPQTGCCSLLQAPESPLLSQLMSPQVRGLPQVWAPLLTFSSLPGAQVPSCFLSSSFPLLLSSVLPGHMRIFLVLLGVQGPLLVFSRCSVRIVPFVAVFLMHLWGEMNFTSSYSSAILRISCQLL